MRAAFWLCGALGSVAAASANGQQPSRTQPPEGQEQPVPADPTDAEAQEIVVVGARASERSAQDTKRVSDQIVDSVVAEDIGALPDFNVAEALQRVPGIALNRNEFTGEGSGVSVRGLDRITTSLAGRAIFSGVGRSLNLGEIPAGLVGRVDVYKSPQADQIEAGLGGTVDVRLRNPADLEKLTMSATGRMIYRKLSDSFNPSFSALIGNNWDAGDGRKLGILISGIYDKRQFRTDRLALDSYNDRRNLVDRNGDGVIADDPADGIYTPTTLTTRYSLGEFERWAIGGRIQLRETGDFEIYVDGIYNSYQGEQEHSFIAARTNQTLYGARATLDSYTVREDGKTFETGTFRNMPFQSSTYTQDEKNTVWQIGTGFRLFAGRFQASGDVSLIRSNVNGLRQDYTVGGVAPAFYMDLRPETPYYEYQGVDITNPAAYQPDRLSLSNYPNVGQERAARLDITANLDIPVVSSVQWGVRVTRRTADRIGRDAGVSIIGLTPDSPLSDVLGETPNDLFGGKFDLANTTWMRPLPDAVRNLPAQLQSYGLSPDFPAWNPLLNYSFDETSKAAYVMANIRQNIGQMRLTGNVGVRFVTTRQLGDGYRTGTGGTPERIDIDRSYSDVLPAANLALRITPDLVVRGAYSQVVSKPNFLDLSPTRTLDFDTLEGSGGNPLLQPYRADQYDATVEWYFGRPGFVYAGYFKKDIDGYYQRVSLPEVIEGQTFLISQLINADDAKIDGWEFGYQQQYDFLPGILRGLGGRFSFTHINSNRFNSVLQRDEPLGGLSPNLYNATLTYELGKFRGRLAYNWREQYPINLDPGGALNLPQVRESFGIWDASVTYQLRENVALFLDISNITNERGTEVFTVKDRPRSFFLSDQTIGFGIRGNF